MTIAVLVKVSDGIVLATDSALTTHKEKRIQHVYNSVEKIFQLHSELPIAAVTYGGTSFGTMSMRFRMREIRREMEGQWIKRDEEPFDPNNYSLKQVASKLSDEFHQLARKTGKARLDETLRIVVAGYSSNSDEPEVWEISIDGSERSKSPEDSKISEGSERSKGPDPKLSMSEKDIGWRALAQAATLDRLFAGLERDFEARLKNLVPQENRAEFDDLLSKQRWNVVERNMPLPDAIVLASFMVEVTARATYFISPAPTVGGPIDIASISRHGGLQWVAQKEYHNL